MTLERLMAFTVNPYHERQEQVWDATNSSWSKEPFQIRRMLTETSVRASDRRAVFVETYGAAGGTKLHDPFQGDDGGWLEDPALLDRLVTERLKIEAEALVPKGWKWVEVPVDLPYGYSHGMRRSFGDPIPMTENEVATHAGLLAEYRGLEERNAGQDDASEETAARMDVLEVEMETLEQRPLIYEAGEVARAGVFVTLDRYGVLALHRGFVRPEDEPSVASDGEQAADEAGQGADAGSSSYHQADGASVGTVITSGGPALDARPRYTDGTQNPPTRFIKKLAAWERSNGLGRLVGKEHARAYQTWTVPVSFTLHDDLSSQTEANRRP